MYSCVNFPGGIICFQFLSVVYTVVRHCHDRTFDLVPPEIKLDCLPLI